MDELRLTLLETDDWNIELEIVNDIPYLHCNVNKWTKTVYKEIHMGWALIKRELKDKKGLDYMFVLSPDVKVTKFAEMFGFKTVVSGNLDVLFTRW